MNWRNIAALGLGLTKGRAAAEDKKKKDRAAILAMTGKVLASRQASQDRQDALRDRQQAAKDQAGFRQSELDYRKEHDKQLGEATQEKIDQAKAISDLRNQLGQQGLKLKTLGEYQSNAGTGKYANMSPEQQAAAVQGLNDAGGTALPVPGAVNGMRPMNYGLSPQQAAPINNAVSGAMSAGLGYLPGIGPVPMPPPQAAATVPYFQPNADQAGKRGQVAASTAQAQANTAAIPQRVHETARHNQATETVSGSNLKERTLHDRNTEALGIGGLGERSRHDTVTEGQGNNRLTIDQMRLLGVGGAAKGQPTFKDYQGIIEKNNAEKNKVLSGLQVWDKKANKYSLRPATPHEQSIVDQADYNIHQAQHGQRAAAKGVNAVTGQGVAPMSPIGNGFQLMRLPGLGSVSVPGAPPLPGSRPDAPPHHSHAQPRRKTGAQAGQFKKGKSDLSKLSTTDLMKMLPGGR